MRGEPAQESGPQANLNALEKEAKGLREGQGCQEVGAATLWSELLQKAHSLGAMAFTRPPWQASDMGGSLFEEGIKPFCSTRAFH